MIVDCRVVPAPFNLLSDIEEAVAGVLACGRIRVLGGNGGGVSVEVGWSSFAKTSKWCKLNEPPPFIMIRVCVS